MDWIRFGQIITGLLIFVLAKQTQGQDCDTSIRLRRGTKMEALLGEQLRISCPVTFCSNTPPAVTWYKLNSPSVSCCSVNRTDRIQTWWRDLTEHSGIAVLLFTNISKGDAGLYQCMGYSSDQTVLSHNINVTVTDPGTEEHAVRTTISPEGETANQNKLGFHVDLTRLVLFTLLSSVVLVLLGRWTLKADGKCGALPRPPPERSPMQGAAAGSETADPDSYDDCVSVVLE